MATVSITSTQDLGGGRRRFFLDLGGGVVEPFDFDPGDVAKELSTPFNAVQVAVSLYHARANPESTIVGKNIIVDFAAQSPIRIQ